MNTDLPRHLPIEGTHNFRDAGGYSTRSGGSVRWRTLFRSDNLNAVTNAGREEIRSLGIRTTIDLRAAHEAEIWPSVFADGADLAYVRLPLAAPGSDTRAPAANDLFELNRMFLDSAQGSLATLMDALADRHEFPMVVHCAGGKDRTGLLVAMLLELAGVDRTDVVADYALSARYSVKLIETLTARATAEGRDLAQFARLMECRPEIMEHTLTYLDSQYGGTERYLRGIGLSDSALASLRSSLTA
ncbi:MAG: tyrosine-protein phosphatase [Chloroflexi bacterium]|nr:tyrosine-protein phosphatase [Chloroflexota bacterium]